MVPVHEGRRGNPALLGRTLFAAASRLDGDEGARRLLAGAKRAGGARHDDAVTVDIDQPDVLRQVEREVPMSSFTVDPELCRCGWAGSDPLYCAYHDTEWGVPEYDSRALWEKLVLDGFQAGLAWITILRKRDALPERIRGVRPGADRPVRRGGCRAADAGCRDRPFTRQDRGRDRQCARLSGDARCRRGFRQFRLGAARAVCRSRTPGRSRADVPTDTALSRTLSTALRARGFKFVGPVIVYAWMQATGMVNDHVVDCFRYKELGGPAPAFTGH